MRVTKLTLFGSLALIGSVASAHAIEVTKRIQAPGDLTAVWEIAGPFCAIKDWHPAVKNCEEAKEGEDGFRLLTLQDGGKIKEKLTESSDESYSYEIVESPLPVKGYKATFSVEPGRSEGFTTVVWTAEFEANGASEEEAKKIISDIFGDGLKGIKKKALELVGGQSTGGGPAGTAPSEE
jgi:hypothetical protein